MVEYELVIARFADSVNSERRVRAPRARSV